MKFKLFRQLEGMDCGPACIQMIAFHYGKKISLYTLRDKCNVTRLGVSGDDIVNGSRALGFNAMPCFVPTDKVEKMPLSAIIHWRQSHFVVLFDIYTKNGIKYYHIADPQYGIVALPEIDFQESWTNNTEKGYAILLEPTEAFNKLVSERSSLRENIRSLCSPLYNSLSQYSSKFISVAILTTIIAVINWGMPFLLQNAVDKSINNKELSLVVLLLLGQIICFIGYYISAASNNVILTKLGFSVSINLLTKYLHKIIKLPISFFDTRLNTDLLQRMEDLKRIQNLLTNQLQMISLAIINLIVFSCILTYYDIRIFFVYILFSTLATVVSKRYLNKLQILNYSKFTWDAEIKNLNYEIICGMPEIKINNAQEKKIQDWEKVQHKINKVSLNTLFNSLYMSAWDSFIVQIGHILILIIVATSVINNELTIGVMMTISYIIGQLSNATNIVMSFFREVVETKTAIERVNEVFRRTDENSTASHRITQFGDIICKDVFFKYEGSYNPYVLKSINLNIPKGKFTAIVGVSGSGKTTLMKLLLSFYKPNSGVIFIGNKSLHETNTDFWRQECGVVMQSGYIYSGSVKENIALASIDVNIDDIKHAAKLACADDFISKLPRGYDTKIGNNGVGLSGGQIQRILIARAIYKQPQYLFFDEATSSLDATNEKTIMDNLYNFYKGRTVVVIAHRLSTVRDADNIIFLNDGKVVETGTHKELLALKGQYYELVKDQLELNK